MEVLVALGGESEPGTLNRVRATAGAKSDNRALTVAIDNEYPTRDTLLKLKICSIAEVCKAGEVSNPHCWYFSEFYA